MRQYAPEPRTYELMTILSPEVPDDDIQGQLDSVAGYVTGAGGEVVDVNRESPWGRRRLAYAIRHNGRDVRDGYYTVFHLRLVPTRVVEIEREIKLNAQIIRHLITQYEPQTESPTEAATTIPADADGQPRAEAGEQPSAPTVEPESAAPATPRRRTSRAAQAATEATAPESVEAAQAEPAAAPESGVAEAAASEPAQTASADTPEAADSQPQVETAGGTDDQVAEADTTTPGDEPENPPAQPEATPEEE